MYDLFSHGEHIYLLTNFKSDQKSIKIILEKIAVWTRPEIFYWLGIKNVKKKLISSV